MDACEMAWNRSATNHGLIQGFRTEFAADSPLEGSGFEPSVPPEIVVDPSGSRAEIMGRSTDVFQRDRESDVSALPGRLSTSSQNQCSTDPGLIAAGTLASTTFPDAGPDRDQHLEAFRAARVRRQDRGAEDNALLARADPV